MASLSALGGADLGAAVTRLVAQAAWLPAVRRAPAEEAIRRALSEGPSDGSPIVLDATGLVEVYRQVVSDPERHDVRVLVVELLAAMDLGDVLAVVPTDSAGMSLRARLETEIRGLHGEVTSASAGGTRGLGHALRDDRADAYEDLPGLEDAHGRGLGAENGDRAEIALDDAAPAPRPRAPQPPGLAPSHESDGGAATTAAGAGSPAGPARRRYRAYGLLACDETVLVGRPFPLELGLSKRPSEGVSGGPMNLPEPAQQPYRLDVQLFADGFDLDPGEGWRHSLAVSRTDDDRTLYPTVTVHLTARPQQDPVVNRKISATFTIDGETLGLAERQLQVTTDESDLPAADMPAPLATGANISAPTGEPKAHLTITLRKGAGEGDLVWGIESTLPNIGLPEGRPVRTEIGRDPQAFTEELIQDLYVQGHGAALFQLLQGIGKTVRNAMPPVVRDAIAAAGQAAKPDRLHILLLTEEPFVPWELAWVDAPWEPHTPNYLGAQAVIGRWALSPGVATDPPRNVEVRTMAVVSGVYTRLQRLLAAEEEAKRLHDDYGFDPIDAQPQPVADLLDGNPAADVIHFAVHGKYDPGGPGDGIYLVSGPPVSPLQIVGADLTARAPFVFLNACQVGAAGEKLGDYNGIAAAFLEAGAGAVIAPLWSVDDTIAQQIALTFYAAAIGAQATPGGPAPAQDPPLVAELLREARAGIVDHAAERSATYLAYQFYGHPSLHLTWRPATAPGGPGNG